MTRGRSAFATAALCAASALTATIAPAPAAATTVSPWQAVGWSDNATGTSLNNAMFQSNADVMRNDGRTGKGIGIAQIDTGVAPVPGLTGGNIVNGPDLSFEGQDPAKRYVDLNGHGTHLAAITAGRPSGSFTGGVAPDAKLTSIKVGSANGAVDVSQVIAAVDWVVKHRNDDAANKIRILQISYGTDGVQPSTLDPLAHAVENAWRAGIVVVAAAGNVGGNAKLLNPASDPYVLSVGALDTKGTSSQGDDIVTTFTNRGDTARRVDIVVPGRTLLSLRAPNSYIDVNYPTARVGTNMFKGSGTSQAAAFAAGAIALLLQAKPTWTPDMVKSALRSTGVPIKQVTTQDSGIKYMDVASAMYMGSTSTKQTWAVSTGKGTIEGARGSVHVADGTYTLTGENTIWGPFSAATWAAASAGQTVWGTTAWMGLELTGTGYLSGVSTLSSWSGRAWSGRAWSGRAWSGESWSAVAWLNAKWATADWT